MKTIQIPETLGERGRSLIKIWYPPHKLPRLLNSDGRKCKILEKKSPFPESSFVKCNCEAAIEFKNGKKKRKFITATIIILNEWIK